MGRVGLGFESFFFPKDLKAFYVVGSRVVGSYVVAGRVVIHRVAADRVVVVTIR